MYNEGQITNEAWQNCMNLMRQSIPDEEFIRWFKPIVPIKMKDNCLVVRVPNVEHATQIEKKYQALWAKVFREIFGLDKKLKYACIEENKNLNNNSENPDMRHFVEQSTDNVKNPFVIPGIRRLVIDPQLNPNYNFGNFIEGDCNRLTRSVGLSVALDPGNTAFNPMFIFGDSGLGKTHLAHAIGLEAKQHNPHLNVLYVSANRFQAQFQTAATKGELNDFIHFYQMIDVLIIDDIQELSGKPKTQNTFFNIFNSLHLTNKQLIITSDKSPVELQDIEQRLITRFKWGFTTQLQQPDYQTKLKIIRSKAEKLNIDLSEDVVEYIAENITSNVREIEGALVALMAQSSMMNRKITVSLTREIMKVYVKENRREITIDSVIEQVSQAMNVSVEDINSKKRTREIAQARQLAMYLCKQYASHIPLATIGASIGGKNHSTVLHACKTVANLIETDKGFKAQVEEIERALTQK
jgi:chromosomal replication initiator protein